MTENYEHVISNDSIANWNTTDDAKRRLRLSLTYLFCDIDEPDSSSGTVVLKNNTGSRKFLTCTHYVHNIHLSRVPHSTVVVHSPTERRE